MGIEHPDPVIASRNRVPTIRQASLRHKQPSISLLREDYHLLVGSSWQLSLYFLIVDDVKSTKAILDVEERRFHCVIVVE